MKYATTGKRIGAYLLDQLIITGIYYFVHMMLAFFYYRVSFNVFLNVYLQNMINSATGKFVSIIVYVCTIIILAVLESGNKMATVGKRACKIIVSKSNGTRISMLDALTRNCAKMLPSLISVFTIKNTNSAIGLIISNFGFVLVIVSFIMVCAGKEKKSIHDFMAATVVIPKEMARSLTPAAIVAAAQKEVYDMPIINTVYQMPEVAEAPQPAPVAAEVPQTAPAAVEVPPTAPVVEEPKKYYKLLALSGQFAGKTFELDKPLVFGREAGRCNLVFEDKTRGVSRVHGKVYIENEKVYIKDLGSSHGTFMENGSSIMPNVAVELKEGDSFYPANKEEMFKIIISE